MTELAFNIALVPVVVGVVQAIKVAAGLDTRFAPLMSLILGILFSWLTGTHGAQVILEGVLIGLSASGLYSGTKATFAKSTNTL